MKEPNRPSTSMLTLGLFALLAFGCDSPTQQTSPNATPAAGQPPGEVKPQAASAPAGTTPAAPTAAAPTAQPATPVSPATPATAATPTPPEPPKEPAVTPPPSDPSKPSPDAAPALTPSQPLAPAAAAPSPNAALKDPSLAKETAPESFKAKFTTTKGDFTIEVTRAWSPNGADRFYNLVKIGYFDGVAFFRNIAGFMVQFGINGDPAVNAVWRNAQIKDDGRTPSTQSNRRGNVTFAKSGAPNSRTTQIFINFGNNGNLDGMGFTPFGTVAAGMDVVDSLYNEYGEGLPRGRGPDQGRLQMEGNAYLKKDYPNLDYVQKAVILP